MFGAALSALKGISGSGNSAAAGFMPSLGATSTQVSTGASTSNISFGKEDGNDLIKYGIMAAVGILALVVFKRKK